MAKNDFLIFDETQNNTLTQIEYAADSQRIGGVVTGLARSNLQNKVLHQVSIMVAALGQLLADQGYDVVDNDFLLLVEQLQSFFEKGSYVIADDGTKYRWGMSKKGAYLQKVSDSGENPDPDDESEAITIMLNLDGEVDTGFYAAYDGTDHIIQNAVGSLDELTEENYYFEIL